jgi:hypothetical protein
MSFMLCAIYAVLQISPCTLSVVMLNVVAPSHRQVEREREREREKQGWIEKTDFR